MAMRVAESLINRFPFPKDFVAEVRLRIQELCVGEESISYGHENQAVFTQEVDTQLLTWLAR